MTKRNTSNTIITSLPEDMLAEILKHAASNSVTDFINTGLSCKAFHRASNNDLIFKNVSMKKHPLIPWFKSERVFQRRCEVAKNAEALYRRGMIDYFSQRKPKSGLWCLKKAAEKGLVEAIYAYGIVLICLGGEQREQGLRLVSLSSFELVDRGRRSSVIIIDGCRLKTKKFFSRMWKNVELIKPKRIDCSCDRDIRERPSWFNGWEVETWEASNNGGHCSNSCFWDREAALSHDLLAN